MRVTAFRVLTFAAVVAWAPATQAVDAPSVTVETLLKTGNSWDGTAYQRYPDGPPELTMLKISVPPNTTLPWHTHPMPNAAYVVSGELLVEKHDGGLTKRLVAGDVLPEMVGSVHRGVTGEAGVVLLVFYAGTMGMPLSQQ
jgi:quercetin dioxygenase-like cupin family protein